MVALAIVIMVFSQLVMASDSQIIVSCSLSVERDRIALINGQKQKVVPLSVASTGEGSNVQLAVNDAQLEVEINADFDLEYDRGGMRLYHGKFNIIDLITGQQFGIYLETFENLQPLIMSYRAQFLRHGAVAAYDAKVICEMVN